MIITIQVRPVLLKGNLSDDTYYGFEIIGLPNKFNRKLIMRSADGAYPGNDAMREFINSKTKSGD